MTGPTLLYIDDTPADVELLRLLLEPHGIMLVSAPTGTRGIAMYDPHQHHAVMIDWNLPDMNGLSVAQALRARYPDCRIAFLSALFEEEHIEAARVMGISDCFEKSTGTERTRAFVYKSMATL